MAHGILTDGNWLRVLAPAKLNLSLKIVGVRSDGMHLVDSLVALIDRCDRIAVRPRKDGKIHRLGESSIPAKSDLALLAAKLLKCESGSEFGADIRMEKSIPVGGGLGGGSSDAAAVLLALNRLWNLRFSRRRLMELAAHLGADIPFFIFGENARVGGIGEIIAAQKIPKRRYLAVIPPVQSSTKKVFAAFGNLTKRRRHCKIAAANDLTDAAVSLYPPIGDAMQTLKAAAGKAQMSGSGACVFADFADAESLNQAAMRLPPNVEWFAAAGLNRRPAAVGGRKTPKAEMRTNEIGE